MPRLGLFNIALGFGVLFFAASAGIFLSNDVTKYIVHDKELLDSWSYILKRSAHAHTNLFGMLHVLFGLTIPYSLLNSKMKLAQTIGFGCGTAAMAFGMLWQAWQGPRDSIYDATGFILGTLLSLSLLAMITHAAGVFAKFNKREA